MKPGSRAALRALTRALVDTQTGSGGGWVCARYLRKSGACGWDHRKRISELRTDYGLRIESERCECRERCRWFIDRAEAEGKPRPQIRRYRLHLDDLDRARELLGDDREVAA